jgi:hypothetical protein
MESGWLGHENFFLQEFIHIGRFYVHMMDLPATSCSKCNHGSDGGPLYYGGKGFLVIYTFDLLESFRD